VRNLVALSAGVGQRPARRLGHVETTGGRWLSGCRGSGAGTAGGSPRTGRSRGGACRRSEDRAPGSCAVAFGHSTERSDTGREDGSGNRPAPPPASHCLRPDPPGRPARCRDRLRTEPLGRGPEYPVIHDRWHDITD
jgi:hypothetical protein